ncbi:MAG: DUF2071 domain-containing protein [Verrucomicrobiales bacterium]
MKSPFNNHPLPVEATFDYSLVLTYALPEIQLQGLIPAELKLDTHEGNAFVAVAMVQTKRLRPKGFPKFLGRDFFLIGYRIFVRYQTSEGKNRRGLFILRSETNKPQMKILGSLFTHYDYNTIDSKIEVNENSITVKSSTAKLDVHVETNPSEMELPTYGDGDPVFTDWKTARKFAGPLPFTFTRTDNTGEMLIIEGVRQHWKPKPVSVVKSEVGFLDSPQFIGHRLASAFLVENVDYSWKKGYVDKCP